MLIHGSCHCGNIAYELDWTPDPVEIPAGVRLLVLPQAWWRLDVLPYRIARGSLP